MLRKNDKTILNVFKGLFYFRLCVCVGEGVVFAYECGYPLIPEKGTQFPGTGGTGSGELP